MKEESHAGYRNRVLAEMFAGADAPDEGEIQIGRMTGELGREAFAQEHIMDMASQH
ncbi:hypothetical protein [Paenibacillus validus]|uniref:hypothetical protein n=1 Tax=Paenibacillus validus TaxID=44253 RepID=UPI003D28C966